MPAHRSGSRPRKARRFPARPLLRIPDGLRLPDYGFGPGFGFLLRPRPRPLLPDSATDSTSRSLSGYGFRLRPRSRIQLPDGLRLPAPASRFRLRPISQGKKKRTRMSASSMSVSHSEEWWTRQASNLRQSGYEPGALPTELRVQQRKICPYSSRLAREKTVSSAENFRKTPRCGRRVLRRSRKGAPPIPTAPGNARRILLSSRKGA